MVGCLQQMRGEDWHLWDGTHKEATLGESSPVGALVEQTLKAGEHGYLRSLQIFSVSICKVLHIFSGCRL
jgi:hypothetical protein